jgi:NitT/TauT family transport system permease protein
VRIEWAKKEAWKLMPAVVGFGLLVLVWWFVADVEWAKAKPQNLWVAHPREVAARLAHLSKTDWESAWATIGRILPGFFLVFFAGVPLGLAFGYLSKVYSFLQGPIDFWRSIPPLAVLPVCFFVFPEGEKSRISLIVFGCLPILIMQVADAFRGIPLGRREFADQIGATFWFKQRSLYLYELLPSIFTGLRMVVSFSVVIAVASEMAWGAGKGLGDRINGARFDYDVPGTYVFALLSGAIGYGANLFLRWAERLFVWK